VLYTKQALDGLSTPERNLWQQMSKKVMRGASGKNTLYLIRRGNTAGIVYASDALNDDSLEVISLFDESLHEPIIYQGAVVVGENMSYARDFMAFLQSDQAYRIFIKYGFVLE
jgi:molybdate transport system substrate-binding protein